MRAEGEMMTRQASGKGGARGAAAGGAARAKGRAGADADNDARVGAAKATARAGDVNAATEAGTATAAAKGGTARKRARKPKAGRDIIAGVFEALGGAEAMAEWVKANPEHEKAFYGTIYPKLIGVQLSAEDKEPVQRAIKIRFV